MPTPLFTLSAFGDEAADDLETQLDILASEGVSWLEFRGAWGTNVLELERTSLQRARQLLDARGFRVSAIGSPIGKSGLDWAPSFELERLERAILAAEILDTSLIRVFSFFISAGQAPVWRDEVISRLAGLAVRAAQAGKTLVLENEGGLYADIPERCSDVLQSINSPALRMAFDPGNFVVVGIRPMAEAWPPLADWTAHVHAKDAGFADHQARPAGEGDGDLLEFLRALAARGYRGYLTLEPHFKSPDATGQPSGEAGMRVAIRALRKLLQALDEEVHTQ